MIVNLSDLDYFWFSLSYKISRQFGCDKLASKRLQQNDLTLTFCFTTFMMYFYNCLTEYKIATSV